MFENLSNLVTDIKTNQSAVYHALSDVKGIMAKCEYDYITIKSNLPFSRSALVRPRLNGEGGVTRAKERENSKDGTVDECNQIQLSRKVQ